MQRVKERALSLLTSGEVDRVLGWKAGEFFYDLTPLPTPPRQKRTSSTACFPVQICQNI